MLMNRDVPLTEFQTVKLLKQNDDTCVSIVRHTPTGSEMVIKAYNREKVMETSMIERVLAERDILRMVSGIQVQDKILGGMSQISLKGFPRCLNRLVTTTKDDDSICLVLERAQGIDLVEFIKLLQPRLKWDADTNVFEFTQELESFLKMIAV